MLATANTNRGAPPCAIQVTNSGALTIVDADKVVWNINNAPVLASPNSGQLQPGQLLNQAWAHPPPIPRDPPAYLGLVQDMQGCHK